MTLFDPVFETSDKEEAQQYLLDHPQHWSGVYTPNFGHTNHYGIARTPAAIALWFRKHGFSYREEDIRYMVSSNPKSEQP